MKLSRNTRVADIGMPRFFPGSNGEAVLVIHGFTGLTDDMLYLGQRLNQAGYTVSLPRLPGHGTNAQDFQASRAEDWLRRSIDSYLDLHTEYEKVYVTGLSMGGILTVLLASLFPIPRIALAAPAITNTNKKIYLTPFLRFFRKKKPKDYTEEDENPERQAIASEYWKFYYSQQLYELLRLQLKAKRALRKVSADTLTIVSKQDFTVPLSVADLIEKKIAAQHNRRVVLEKSDHVLVNDVEKEIVADEIIKWFRDEASA